MKPSKTPSLPAESVIFISARRFFCLSFLLCSAFQGHGQCAHNFNIYKQYPSGPVCNSQPVTLRAEYYPHPNTYVSGEFRWYENQTSASPFLSWFVGTDANWYSDYNLYPADGTTIWVSFYDHLTSCETIRISYGFAIPPVPTLTQQYARACGDGIGKIQMSSTTSNVTFQLNKQVGGSYQYLGSSTSGYFELPDFYGEGADQYYISGTTISGCPSSNYYQVYFDIQPDNLPPVVTGTTSYCQGTGTTLTASGGNGSFRWYNSGGGIESQSAQLNTPTGLSSGTYNYSVERISPGGCITSKAYPIVTVKPLPEDGTISASAATICLGQSVTISSTGGVGAPHYWCSNNGEQSWNIFADAHAGESSFSFTPTQPGTYRFHLRNKTECGFCWDSGNNGCPTYPYVDVTVSTPPVGGVTKSTTTDEAINIVYGSDFGTTTLAGAGGYVKEWQYSFDSRYGPFSPWGQNGATTTTETCCIIAPGKTIWVRAAIERGTCPVDHSEPTSYFWQSTPPFANAGTDKFTDTSKPDVIFNGSASGGNGLISSYLWVKVYGPQATLNGANTKDLIVTGFMPGVYRFTLTVTDSYGYQSQDNADLTVILPNNYNYIKETTLLKAGITESQIPSKTVEDKAVTTTYFDGLGRPIQVVMLQGSPSLKDLVQPMKYDPLGRQASQFLPYAASQTNGWYKENALHDPNTTETHNPGKYRSGQQYLFYQGGGNLAADQYPYSQTIFESNPLSRTLQQVAPGEAWQPAPSWGYNYNSGDPTIRKLYETNTDSEVLKWTYVYPTEADSLGTVDASTGLTPIPYLDGKLFKNLTKDEQQNQVIEYIDIEGKVILRRVQAVSGTPAVNDANYASTYYVYDDFDNLVCVIPPEAVRLITQQNAYFGKSTEEKTKFLQQWAFRYKYDNRKRMVMKQVPGAKYVYMLYDNRDRLVMTQDGNQRARLPMEWTFMKYDALNRPVATGTYTNNEPPQVLQGNINTFYSTLTGGTAWYETYTGDATGNVMGYDNSSFPQVSDSTKYLTATYYDFYDRFIAPSGFGPATPVLPGEIPATQDKKTGQVTAILVKNLVTGVWMRTVNYYDDKYRVIQTIADHQKGTVRASNVYDFAGRLMHTQRRYIVGSTSTIVKENFTYDHASRPLSMNHSINGATPVVLSVNEYNELGLLITKKLHRTLSGTYVTPDPAFGQPGVVYANNIDLTTYSSAQHTQIAKKRVRLLPNLHVLPGSILKARIGFSQQDAEAHNNAVHEDFLQVIDYRYNIRGWLNKINDPTAPLSDDLFSMELRYNTPSAKGGTAQYNGNISEAIWKSAGMDKQSYGYYYDNMNRITEAKYFNTAKPMDEGRYNEKIGDAALNRPGYDLNGNILNLFRKGKTAESTYGLMDDLHYDYNNSGNKLLAVSDARPTNTQEEGFKEIADGEGTLDYTYDANGNMTKDKNKGITGIEYNYLNLPSKVSKSANEYIIYTYDATGRKLSQQVFGTTPKTTDYIGELVYEGNALQFINHSEGRVVKDNSPQASGPWEYQYFLKDHLGNTRVVFSEKKNATEYKATMETDRQAEEQQVFKKYNALGVLNLFDHTDDGAVHTRSHLLNGGNNYQVGLAKSFVVNPGDVVDLEVYAKYEAVASPPANNVNGLLSGLVSAFSLGAGTTPLDGSQAQTAFNSLFPSGAPWINSSKWDPGAPKAYLNYILFNEHFQLVDFGFDQISTAAAQAGVSPDVDHDYLSLYVKVQQKGYLYIYVSNENPMQTNVYFDDMKIVHYTAVEQVSDYYPFGLTFNSYQRENSVDQKSLYNGKELQDELNLGWLDYGARMYESMVGRWVVCDPLADKYYQFSPYVYVANDPVRLIDPDGRKIVVPNVKDRSRILDMINSKAKGAGFAFNEKGELYLVKAPHPKDQGSSYYSEKLLLAIQDKHTISIEINGTFKDTNGQDQSVDKEAGGGVTRAGIKDGERFAEVIISGNANYNLKDEAGNSLKDEPADILVHEIVGHAVPYATATKDTGNAVDNENKVREQQPPGNNAKRAQEPDHKEQNTVPLGTIKTKK